jgi:hypothetical protein
MPIPGIEGMIIEELSDGSFDVRVRCGEETDDDGKDDKWWYDIHLDALTGEGDGVTKKWPE